MRSRTAMVGCTDSLLHTMPSGVVDQIRTTAKNEMGTSLGRTVADGIAIQLRVSEQKQSKILTYISQYYYGKVGRD
ncbi:hypothetical protein TUM4644_01500 [Shewanella colwelliana]|nr:hypothetical protein TUM4644_01500 [Shewanella colwelliana]